MKASPLDLQGKGALSLIHHHQHSQQQSPLLDPFSFSFPWTSSAKDRPEPRSVLDHIRSPSPPSSTSTLSSSSALAALSDANPPPPWQPPSSSADHTHRPTLDDWEDILGPHDHSFLRCIMSDDLDKPHHLPALPDPEGVGPFPLLDSAPFPLDHAGKAPLLPPPVYDPPSFLPPEAPSVFLPDDKPPLFPTNLLHQLHNPSFLFPFPPYALLDPPQQQAPAPPPAKRLHFTPHDPFPPAAQQQQELVDQLFRAAELVGAGKPVNAQGILARLNHQLSPVGKPLVRSAFYFKEALSAVTTAPPPQAKPPSSPLDVVLKISAYKAFSEISPVPQFTNFTCVQTLLEELAACDRIHILDFDIGLGGQWSSFMQELAQRQPGNAVALLKITAFVSPSSYHRSELILTRDNLAHFATDLGIPFEFDYLSLDSFDPSAFALSSRDNEAIAVSIPVGSSYPATPALLHRLRQLSPKVVVSMDHGCDRSELPFSQHLLNSLESYTVLLESIDAAGASLDATNKIERLLLQPRIEGAVMGRFRAADKTVPWRAMFSTAGFVPVHLSNFTETQAECLLKRVQVRGFHAEKRQSSLVLFWQRGELVSVSAWRC